MDFGQEQVFDLREEHSLEYIGMVFTDGPVAPGNAGYSGFSEIEKCNATTCEAFRCLQGAGGGVGDKLETNEN